MSKRTKQISPEAFFGDKTLCIAIDRNILCPVFHAR